MKKFFTCMIFTMAMLLMSYGYSQSQSISGTINSEEGEPLPGVSVLAKGSSVGAVTDIDGKYSIDIPDGTTALIFSFIGFETSEVPIQGRTTIDFTMTTDITQLNEVVVTALGITREERSLGYATQEVQGDNLTFTKDQNVLGSLAGKVAGVQVVGSSGASMGGTQKIKIRGVNSLSGGDQPLIVVDGTPISNSNFAGSDGADYGNLAQDVNPEDIESVNVLKGPAASALYGIRGQFGVIMITTKKGKKGGGVSVELNSAFSVQKVGNVMPYQNMYGGGSSQTWRTLDNGDPYVDMQVDESWGPRMDGTPVRQIFSFYPQDPTFGQLTPFVPHPDNIKDYYETGTNLNNGISVLGSSENTTYRVSFNDTRIQGIDPNTWLKRNNFGLNMGVDLSKKVNISTNFNFATNSGQRPEQGSENGTRYLGQWFQRSLDMNRLRDYQYDDGTFLHWNHSRSHVATGELSSFTPLYWNNPFFEANENINNDRRDRFFGNVGLSYEVIPNLKLSGFIRSDMYTQNIEERTADGGKDLSAYYVGKFQNREFNYEFLAQYSKEWGELSMNATLGGNIYDRRYNYLSEATVGGLSSPGYYNIDASIDRPATSSYLLRKQIRSAYGMLSFGYRNIYFLDATIRNDNSSALPDANNSYWYPSISGSMVFSELLNVDAFSLGKVRLSYARAGSDLAPYGISPTYYVGTVYNGISTLAVPDLLNNPNLEPSFTDGYEAGLDLKFLEGRIGMQFTYYLQKNKNDILELDVSGTSGYGSANINAGLIENKGIEIALTASPFRAQNFGWDLIVNFAHNQSEVVELYQDLAVYQYGYTTYSSTSSYMNSYVGQPYGSLVGQAYERDPDTGKILLDEDNLPLYTDGTHNFGSVLPDATGGFINMFRFWNFDLSASIDFQIGGQFFSRSKMLAVRTGLDPLTVETNDRGHNVREDVDEGGGVRVDGISAETGEAVTAYVDPQEYYGVVGRRIYEEWLYDASYVKLRELRLGYTFGAKVLENLPFKKVSLAFIASNPLMIWQDAPEGLDPSELSRGSQSISWFESGQLNSVRSYGFNLDITF